MSFFMPLHGNVQFEKESKEEFAITVANRIDIGDTGAFYDNISAEALSLFLLEQTYKSLLFTIETFS